jgi:acyl dehydratase
MAVDPARALAVEFPAITMDLERGRLRAFARATGQTDPTYVDVDAARAAGHPDLPVPPTFYFSIELEADPLEWLTGLDVDPRGVLHGEQSFDYRAMTYAGDVVEARRRVVSANPKTPTMDFVTTRTEFTRDGEVVATSESLIIVRATEAVA